MAPPLNIFALDVETSISNKGDPFDSTNTMVLGAVGTDQCYHPFHPAVTHATQKLLDSAKLVILFNAKFDLHWCRRIGLRFHIRLPVWDCQLAEFILSNQRWKYPSLDESCAKRNLPRKLDVVKKEYWEKGIDTTAVPNDILNEYLQGDIRSTYLLYLAQVDEFKKPEHIGKYKLFRLQCYDLMVLEEMEYNGFLFGTEAAQAESLRLEKESTRFDAIIYREYPDIPINIGSPTHISSMLFGGEIKEDVRVPIGVYKTGAKVGQPKYKLMEKLYTLPRLIEPLRGSELATAGKFGTSEDVLMSLPAKGKVKKVIDALLERRGVEKLRGTYYDGIPTLIQTHNWENNIVHGQYNQCVTITGRLSATKPNSQNMPGGCKKFCISRYS
jgi:DNA polymerase I-like protein with 3'-5' exonuclease and polymerase domains